MSVDINGQLITFECDECGKEISIAARNFKAAWEEIRDERNWRAFQNSEGEWEHSCSDCVG